MQELINLLSALIACPSVTPNDAGCQQILKTQLQTLGFTITDLPAGGVSNFWAKRGDTQPLFVFAGHTDVVTPGDATLWKFNPFAATEHEGYIYGRGTQDMKGAIAAMIIATQQFTTKYPHHVGSIGFLITSGEEGSHYMQGTPQVMDYLAKHQEKITWSVVGEPSSQQLLGDTIRHGRRGSLHGHLTIQGKQGHVAYHQLAENPIHAAIPVLNTLVNTQWDQGNADFKPTSFQITSIQSGVLGENKNVIPNALQLYFNFRNSPMSSAEDLQKRVIQLLEQQELNYSLEWELSGMPFITQDNELRRAATHAVQTAMGFTPEFSTSGGTSDARFIAPTGAQVIELGVINDRIHQIDERVSIRELEQLTQVYFVLLETLLISKKDQQ